MNSLHGNVIADTLVSRAKPMGGASRATGSMLVDLKGFSGAEILITRRHTGGSFSTANSIYYYLKHANTAGAAQVPVTASDVAFDKLGASDVSGGNLSQATVTSRIYTSRSTFSTTSYAFGSHNAVKQGEHCIRVGYVGSRRYIRVGYVCSGAAATATGTGYGASAITVLRGRPNQAPLAATATAGSL